MDSLDGRRVDGREIRVVMARYGRPIDERERRGGGGGGGRRGRYESLNNLPMMDRLFMANPYTDPCTDPYTNRSL